MSKAVKRKISIYDVAKEAGVSIATVSRVLNGRDRVAPQTRKSIEKAIKQLEFQPNTQARALSRMRSDTIGLVLPGFRGDYFGRLMEGVDEEAHNAGLQIMVSKATGPQAKIDTIKKILNEGRVDGLILMLEELKGEVLDQLHDSETPIVVLDKDVQHRHLDNILLDNRTGARDATQHLIKAHGISNLLFVGGPKENIDTCDRAEGFFDALKEASIESQSNCFYNAEYSYDSGYLLAKKTDPPLEKIKRLGNCGSKRRSGSGNYFSFAPTGISYPRRCCSGWL